MLRGVLMQRAVGASVDGVDVLVVADAVLVDEDAAGLDLFEDARRFGDEGFDFSGADLGDLARGRCWRVGEGGDGLF